MKKIILIICAALLSASCIKDLNTEPLEGGTSLTSQRAWADTTVYESMLAKIYSGFSLTGNAGPSGMPDIVGIGDEGETSFIRSWWNLQELTADEALCSWANNGIAELNFCTWTSSNRFVQFVYNRLYMTVAYSNEYLRETTDDKLIERGVNEDLVGRVRGYRNEVIALRALNYYYLLDLYANVPLIDENTALGASPSQVSRTVLFNWIEEQLLSVAEKLPLKSAATYGRINKYAVDMILAKLYLNAEVYIGQNKYSEAIVVLKDIIDNGGYSLEPIYKNLFGAENDLSAEMIFPIIFDGMNSTCYGGTKYLISASYDNDMAGMFGTSEGWSGLRALESLVDKFSSSADDQRALFWTEKRTKETYSWTDFNAGYSVVKYTNLKRDSTAGSHELFPDTDFPLFRLGDVYLMYAEAVLRGGNGGDLATALSYVNELRSRAFAPQINNSELTLGFLLDERCRELYWEGHRRTDLIRFEKFTDNYKWNWKNGMYVGTTSINSNYSVFPLPVTELAANRSLIQNEGY
jgi:hypothetical protein